jgi:hypothetical protein
MSTFLNISTPEAHAPRGPMASARAHVHGRYRGIAVALVTGLFLALAGTGVLLFWDWSPSTVRIAHGWLGLAFLGAGVWHLTENWRPFRHALTRVLVWGTLALSLVAAGVLILATAHEPGQGGGDGLGRHRHWSETVVPGPISPQPTVPLEDRNVG